MTDENSIKSVEYYQGINNSLLNAVPSSAKVILEVGCAEGRLGAALKILDPERLIYGIEKMPTIAKEACSRLDQVFVLDVENELPDIPAGSLDCILYGDVLEHLVRPLEVLKSHRYLLKPTGQIICCIPNVQHFSVVRNLISGDFQYESTGLMDATNLRFFTYSSFIKLLLDSGYAPELVTSIGVADGSDLLSSTVPLIRALGLDVNRTISYLTAYQYVFRGVPLHWNEDEPDTPISFVVCVNNEEQLKANLLRSDCFKEPSIHELILVRDAQNAADGLNTGLNQASNEIVVLLHQDVYLPPGWTRRFVEQYSLAEQQFGSLGLVGLFGVLNSSGQKRSFGHVADRHTLLSYGPLPALAETVDEFLMAVPKSTKVRFDPALKWHLYGADFALQTMQQGKFVAVVDALCFHHSRTGYVLPEDYHRSAAAFRSKWISHLPICTPCWDFT